MVPQNPDAPSTGEVLNTFTTRQRIVLTFTSILCGVLLVWVARLAGIPGEPGFAGSILRDQAGFGGVVVLGVGFVGCSAVASVLTGRVRYEAGLFCAGIGLAFISARAGTIRSALQDAAGGSVYILLSVETASLFAFLGVGSLVIRFLGERGVTTTDPVLEDDTGVPLTNKILATVTTAAIIVVLTSLLAQADDKGQVLASVAIASVVGAIGGHTLFPTRGGVWFWTAPLLAAVVGYAHAGYVAQPAVYLTGMAPSNLGRALPLDFASVGAAGAILGYWTARRWKYAQEIEESTDADAPSRVVS